MRGNFSRTNQRPSLKRRIQSLRDQNARLARRDAKHRCANPQCKASLVNLTQTLCIAGDPLNRRFCCALCVDDAEAPQQHGLTLEKP